ncbi:hypothetical protein [Streptomyces sp. NPDC001717]|uniref:hypothetical protein n=1 Tax=Streptomyces sp. NPDC001717 TaxID=3364604 RepID=UPI0036B1DD41
MTVTLLTTVLAVAAPATTAAATDCRGVKGCMNKSMANGKASFYKGGMAFMDGNQAGVNGFQQGLNKGQNGFQKQMGPKKGGGGGMPGMPGM